MNKVDRQALEDLVENPRSTRVSIVTYLSIIAVSKLDKETEYPTIRKFNIFQLYKNMKDKMHYINESSVRLAIERLIDQGFIAYLDEEKTILVVLNSGAGHMPSEGYFKSRGYITLHHLFFDKAFFKLRLRTMKIAIIVLSRLNNCADKSVKLNFKSKKNPESFPYYCRILKVNRLAHIRYAIEELKPLFHIVELDHNTVEFKLNTISKPTFPRTSKLFKFTKDQLSRVEVLIKESNKYNLDFKVNQVEEICAAICSYPILIKMRTIKELCKNSRNDVRNIFGYTKSIAERLKAAM